MKNFLALLFFLFACGPDYLILDGRYNIEGQVTEDTCFYDLYSFATGWDITNTDEMHLQLLNSSSGAIFNLELQEDAYKTQAESISHYEEYEGYSFFENFVLVLVPQTEKTFKGTITDSFIISDDGLTDSYECTILAVFEGTFAAPLSDKDLIK